MELQPYVWLITAIASPGQSDEGGKRYMYLHCYSIEQAWAWSQEWFGKYATVTKVEKVGPCNLSSRRV